MASERRQAFHIGEWLVTPELHRISRGDEERPLEPKVMQVLLCLASRPGQVVGHEELIDEVWDGMAVSGNVVTYSIAALRKALEDDWRSPRYVETISKSGYRLIMPLRSPDDVSDAAGMGAAETSPGVPTGTGSAHTAAAVDISPQGHAEAVPVAMPGAAEPPARTASQRVWLAAGAAGALLALGIVGAATVLMPEADPGSLMLQPVPVTTFPGSEIQPTLSPDGNHVAFAWMKEGRADRDLYVTLVGAESPSPLATTEDNERSPAWTPDGLYIAYARWKMDGSDCGIYRIPAVGGTSERIAECPGRVVGNMSFSADGRLLGVGALGPAGEPAQIYVLDLETDTATLIGDPPPDRQGDYYPMFSPDGEWLSFQRFRGDGLSDVYKIRPDGSDLTRLTFDDRDIGGTDWSADGETLFFSSYRAGQYTLWAIPAAGGEPRRVAINDHNIISPSLSHAQNRIVYSKGITDVNLWATRLTGEGTPVADPTQVTAAQMRSPGFWAPHDEPEQVLSSTVWEAHPQISPDGARVAFASDRSGSFEIYSAALDGTDLRRHTSFGGPFVGTPRWSPDGGRIVFDARPDGHADLWFVDVESSAPRQLTRHPDDEFAASYSHDGAWIYFTSHRSGDWQIWRMPSEGGEAEVVTERGGYSALESPEGDLLYFTKYDAPGLWRRPIDGSAREALVHPSLSVLDWANWTVRPEGIYAVNQSPPALMRWAPDTQELTPVMPFPASLPRQTPAFSISADGRLVVWAQVDMQEDDIYLAEGIGR